MTSPEPLAPPTESTPACLGLTSDAQALQQAAKRRARMLPNRHRFYAEFFRAHPENGAQTHHPRSRASTGELVSTDDPLMALKVALQMALVQCSAKDVQALLARETAAMTQSLQSHRRKPGEVVALRKDARHSARSPSSGPALWCIEGEEPLKCPVCGNPTCREWPTLRQLSPRAGVMRHHVSECAMLTPS